MKFKLKTAISLLSLSMVCASGAFACDLCSIYSSIELQKPAENTFRLGLTEQYTEFGKTQLDGKYFENTMHQRMESSVTQILASYDLSPKFTIQTTLPYINRSYRRSEGEGMQRGTEAGVGDMAILGRYSVFQQGKNDSYYNVQLLGGLKLPTGNARRLKEELAEDHHHDGAGEEGDAKSLRHGGEDHYEVEDSSAIHGHDLALGSGSVDFPVGLSIIAQEGKFFARGSALYSIRTAGDHQYQYADDFMWDFGPGYYFYTEHESTAGLRVALSGENKSKDSGKDGVIQTDTGITTLFLGPEINFTVSNRFNGLLGWDMPLEIDNSGYQSVPSYRLRAGLTYRF